MNPRSPRLSTLILAVFAVVTVVFGLAATGLVLWG